MGWIKNTDWRNGKSYITQEELFMPKYIDIINKLSLVLWSEDYYEDTKIFCRSVLGFAIDHEFITWKQANAVLRIEDTETRRVKYATAKTYRTVHNPFIYARGSMTDRDLDRIRYRLFGDLPYRSEGYGKAYREDDSRYETLPT